MTSEAYTKPPQGRTLSLATFRAERAQADEAAQQVAFDEWCVLNAKAQETAVLSDAIAAGKAWGRFMQLFVGRR